MSRIALVSNDVPVLFDEEVHWVADALRGRGHEVEVVTFDADQVDWAAFSLVVIRSPWDYVGRLGAFLAWTRHVASVTRLVNPAAVVEWNSHKGYLSELEARGVRVLPSLGVPAGGDVIAAVRDCGWETVVVKAAVGGGGFGMTRGPSSDPQVQAFAAALAADQDVVIQPFAPEIARGERSLVFLGGELSHAVRKVPTEGGYLSQGHHGGTELVHEPTGAEMALAIGAMAAAPGELAYARVDLIEIDGEPVLMELEVIEPDLFLRRAPEATQRFAAVIEGWA